LILTENLSSGSGTGPSLRREILAWFIIPRVKLTELKSTRKTIIKQPHSNHAILKCYFTLNTEKTTNQNGKETKPSLGHLEKWIQVGKKQPLLRKINKSHLRLNLHKYLNFHTIEFIKRRLGKINGMAIRKRIQYGQTEYNHQTL
jgi:hypothetical protein